MPLCDAKPPNLLSVSTLYSKYSLGNFDSIDINCVYFKRALAFKLCLLLTPPQKTKSPHFLQFVRLH